MVVVPSRAAVAVRLWTVKNSQTLLAEKIAKRIRRPVSQANVSHWSRGRIPPAEAIFALEDEIGIPGRDWFRPASARDLEAFKKTMTVPRGRRPQTD